MSRDYCPAYRWDCPYWREDETCAMREETGLNPCDECDDFALFCGEEEWEDE